MTKAKYEENYGFPETGMQDAFTGMPNRFDHRQDLLKEARDLGCNDPLVLELVEYIKELEKRVARRVYDGPMSALPLYPTPNKDGTYDQRHLHAYGVACLQGQRGASIAHALGQDAPLPPNPAEVVPKEATPPTYPQTACDIVASAIIPTLPPYPEANSDGSYSWQSLVDYGVVSMEKQREASIAALRAISEEGRSLP